jgi:hypothetical protein
MGIEGWRRKAQDRDQWKRIAQEACAVVQTDDDDTSGCTQSYEEFRWTEGFKRNITIECMMMKLNLEWKIIGMGNNGILEECIINEILNLQLTENRRDCI